MIFPFEITYKKKLTGEIESFSSEKIMSFAKNDFKQSNAFINVYREGNLLTAKIPLGKGTMGGLQALSRWAGISKATFQLIDKEAGREAIYKFNLSRSWIVSAILGLIFLVISQSVLAGLLIFGIFGIVICVYKIIQHWICFDGTFGDIIFESKHGSERKPDLLS
jgi:hypothetical protein